MSPRRQINLKFALLSLLILILGIGIGYGVHRYQVNASAKLFKQRAFEADAEDKVAEAADYFGRYFAVAPNDEEARVKYALLLSRTAKTPGEHEQALVALERAMRDDGSNKELLLKAADSAIALERYSDARVHLDKILTASPTDTNALLKLAKCDENMNRNDDAIGRYELIIKSDPTNLTAAVDLAALFRKLDKVEKANAVMNAMVDANPKSSAARLNRAKYLKSQGLISAAAVDVQYAREQLAASEVELLLLSAELALNAEDVSRARDEFTKGQQTHPKEVGFPLGLAGVELQAGNKDKAREAARNAQTIAGDKPADLWLVANMLITIGDRNEARGIITKLRNLPQLAALADYLDARILVDEQKWIPAINALNASRKDLARNPEVLLQAEMLLALCHERLGNTDKRREALLQALRIDPLSIPARKGLADIELAQGNVDEALTQYRLMMGRAPEMRFVVVRLMIWKAMQLPAAQRNWGDIAVVLEGTPQKYRTQGDFALCGAELRLVQGERDDARKILETARAENPKEAAYWLALARFAEPDWTAVDRILTDAVKQAGDRVALRLARARMLLAMRPPTLTDDLKKLSQGLDKLPEADVPTLLTGLIDIETAAGDKAEADRLINELGKRSPGDLTTRLRLIDAAMARNDLAAVATQIEELRKIEGEDGAVWRYGDALRLAQTGWNEQSPGVLANAKARLQEVRTRRPGWYRVPLLEAEIEDRVGNVELAIEKYQQAIRQGARFNPVIRRTIQLLTSRRRYEDAQILLSELTGSSQAGELGRIAAELSILKNDSLGQKNESNTAILEQAIKDVDPKSMNPEDHLWLAQVYTANNKPADAEKAYRRAVELAPTSLPNRLTLIGFLVGQNRVDDAKAAIEASKAVIPADQLPAFLAQALEMVGDRAGATAQYTALLAARRDDLGILAATAQFHLRNGDPARAESMFREVISRSSPDQAATIRQARRSLAISLASSGEYRKGTEALELVGANLRDIPDSPQDLRLKAMILAGRPGGRKQSIRDLEDSFLRLRPTPEEQFLVAQLYEMDGRTREANERYLSLVTGPGAGNPQFLAYYVRTLLRQKDAMGASTWFTRLKALPGQEKSPAVQELQARVLFAEGKRAEAAAYVERFTRELVAERKNPAILRLGATLLNELDSPAEAETMLREYVRAVEAKNPISALVLAEFLARKNRVPEALTLCEQALDKKADPELTARLTVAVIRLGKPSTPDYARATEILNRARALRPKSTDLVISRADLRDAEGRYEEAIRDYQELLTQKPDDATALNNLGWLLSFRAGNHAEATQLLDRAILASGPEGYLLDSRGVIFLQAGQADRAVSDLTASIDREALPGTYYHLAQAYQKLGNVPEAQRALRKAVELGLEKSTLHILEQPGYEKMMSILGK